jgi:heat shock protein HtpX
VYRAIRKNKFNTVVIMVVFVLIIGGLGWLAGAIYRNWVIAALVVVAGLGYALFQYFLAAKQAISMAGGQRVTEQDNPRLFRTVENLAISQGLPTPEVYVIHDPAPNAFATGRDPKHAKVAATTGLLDLMTDAELEGVMAHELGHVQNYDIRVNMIVYGLVVAIGMLSDLFLRITIFGRNSRNSNPVLLIGGLIAMIIAPLIATLVQLAVSRQREYLADATGAMTTRYPDALASALHKLSTNGQPMKKQKSSMAHMWIANPMKPSKMQRLFSTHPPIEDRIRRLLDNSDRF